jgi:predicted dehydrogenase
MGTGNMRNFLSLPGCRVVAVCDPYQDRRDKARHLVDKAYGDQGCATYGDYRELLARPDLNAVMIATQDHWHALIATAAAAAGKDLYCEKPMGVSIEEGKLMRAAVRKHHRIFQAGTWQRSKSQFRQACELARNGYLGELREIQVAAPGPRYRPKYDGPMDPQPVPAGFDWDMWRGPAPDRPYHPGLVAWPDWYLIWDYCAGFICNWGVHHLDIANWGCPAIGTLPFEVEASADYRKQGFTDNVNGWDATFRFEDGPTLRFTDSTKQQTGCRFIGEEGWVHVDRQNKKGKRIWAEPEGLLTVELKDRDEALPVSRHHQDNFLAAVGSRQDPLSDVDTTHIASYLGLVADIAARLGQNLRWNPGTETFVANDTANRMLSRPMHNGWQL